jgi:hypothetical protein
MDQFNEIFIALIALLIVTGIGLGLLIALVIFILGRQGNAPPATTTTRATTTPRTVHQSRMIANATFALSAGFAALIFAARLIPIKEDPIISSILVLLGIVLVGLALFYFRRI